MYKCTSRKAVRPGEVARLVRPAVGPRWDENQDSSKGGAVETGCSDLYDVIY